MDAILSDVRLALVLVAAAIAPACSLLVTTDDLAGPSGSAPDASTPEVDAAVQEDAAKASGYAAVVLADRPIVYWRMRMTGTTVADETGRGNDLMFEGGVTPVAGPVPESTALLVDGTARGVAEDARVLDFVGTAPFTIEWWMNRSDSGGGIEYQHVFGNYTSNSGRRGYLIYLGPDREVSFERDSDTSTSRVTVATAPPGTWAHYVAAFDGTNLAVYRNGSAADVEAASGPLPSRISVASVAAHSSSDEYHLAASIAEMAIYDRALTREDALRHYMAR